MIIKGGTMELNKHKRESSLLPIFYHKHEDYRLGLKIAVTRSKCMAEIEHPERYNWWMNELDSLGISTLEKDGINDNREASDLTDAVKQTLYEEYLHQAYSGK